MTKAYRAQYPSRPLAGDGRASKELAAAEALWQRMMEQMEKVARIGLRELLRAERQADALLPVRTSIRHFAGTPSPSLLKRLPKGEGGAAE